MTNQHACIDVQSAMVHTSSFFIYITPDRDHSPEMHGMDRTKHKPVQGILHAWMDLRKEVDHGESKKKKMQ